MAHGISSAPSDELEVGPEFTPGLSQHNLTRTRLPKALHQRGASE
jgi:hypothetical protein